MIKRATLTVLLAAAICTAGAAAPAGKWRDVLDTPAASSPLASRSLLNGLAKAGSRTVAVGQRGHALYSDDAGRTWQQAKVPVSSDLVAVHFPTATTGWAVGHDGVVLRSTDAGATWTRQLDGRAIGTVVVDYYAKAAAGGAADAARADALQAEARRIAQQGADNPLLDVWFADEKQGYVVGAFGLILRTADGGATWEPLLHAVDNPKALHLYAVRGIGEDVWITGEQGLVLKLDRATGQFRAIEVPYKGTLFGVVGHGRTVLVHGLRGTLLRSVDGGQSWQPVDTGLQVGLTAGATDGDGRVYVASQAGHILVSANSGATFKRADIERPLPAAALVAVDRNLLVVAGPRGVEAKPVQ
jgi:photosystem II stability/assembly factor-like uncharacterized protein